MPHTVTIDRTVLDELAHYADLARYSTDRDNPANEEGERAYEDDREGERAFAHYRNSLTAEARRILTNAGAYDRL